MKKRLIGTILAAVLVVSQAAIMFAAGSKTAVPTVVGEAAGKYEVVMPKVENLTEAEKEEIVAEYKVTFAAVEEKAPTVLEKIVELNLGEAKLTSLVDSLADMIAEADAADADLTEEEKAARKEEREKAAEVFKTEMEGKELVSQIFDLKPIDGGIKDDDGNYVATLSLPILTDEMKEKDVKLIHFSTERALWEVIEPEEIDFEAKEITAKFADLSPVGVVADEDAAE